MNIKENASIAIEGITNRLENGESVTVYRDEIDAILIHIASMTAEKQRLEDTLKSCEHQLGVARGG